MKKWLTSLFFLALVLIPAQFVFSQDDTTLPTLDITGANASELPTITITTSVTDANGLFVEGLGVDDFTLGGDLDGLATIVNVENVTTDALDFGTVLVVDTSTSMSGLPLQRAKDAASLFVQSINENDPVAIVSFDSQVRVVQDFTTDTDLLLNVINSLQVSGRTALYDAAVQAVQVANDAPTSRRAIVLLSDGAEFGGLSASEREAGLEAAQQAGVPVFTIGLGFGTDRTYLEGLSEGTNADFFESPTPDELTQIYLNLASLFRTQYIITLESDIAGDGTEYAFTLSADTPDGTTPADTGTIRAPIPVPIVRLDDAQFATAFSEPTTITPTILADDDLESIVVSIDDTPIDTAEDGSFTLDPIEYPPGDYTLSVTATDVDGDSGSDSTLFSTAVLAPDVSFVFDADASLTEPTTVTVNAEGQTPATSATYAIVNDDTSTLFDENTDAENDFPLTIDPINYAPGDYTLTVGVVNEGGATANLSQDFTIGEVAPRNVTLGNGIADSEIDEPTDIVINAETQVGAEIETTTISYTDANGNTVPLDDMTLNPANFQPGVLDLTATVTDTNGQTATGTGSVTIAALAPVITLGDIDSPLDDNTSVDIAIESQTPILSVEYNFGDDINIALTPDANGDYPAIPLDIQTIGSGDAVLVVMATNEAGEASTAEVMFSVALPPTATPTPNLTATAQQERAIEATSIAATNVVVGTEIAATEFVRATENSQATADAQATTDTQAVFDAQASETADANTELRLTANAQATVNSQATAEAQSTLDTQATADSQATIEAQSTADAQATTNARATDAAIATSDAQATEAQSTVDAQATTNSQATIDAQVAADTRATLDARATGDAQSTALAQVTADSQATTEAQNTVIAQRTADAQSTASQGTEVAANIAASATATATETLTPTITNTPEPTAIFTLTPVDLVEVEAQDAEENPAEGDTTALIVCAGGLMLIFVLLGILFFGRRRDEDESA